MDLAKRDKLYRDAMETASQSGMREIVEDLLKYFVDDNNRECFAACLYTCFDLVKPDVALELAWQAQVRRCLLFIHVYLSLLPWDLLLIGYRVGSRKKEGKKKIPRNLDRIHVFQTPDPFHRPFLPRPSR